MGNRNETTGDTGSSLVSSGVESFPERVLERDHVYQALSARRRRYICYLLLERAEWSLPALATKIAAWEADVSEHAVTDQTREDIQLSLYHVHVPKLADVDVVTFDEQAETITPGENAEPVLQALDGIATSLDVA